MNTSILNYRIGNSDHKFVHTPNTCPECHTIISPIILTLYTTPDPIFTSQYADGDLLLKCPNQSCEKPFLYHYSYIRSTREFVYSHHSRGTIKKAFFSDSIEKISPRFIEIYNQSFEAEQNKLNEICGMGYRKALEFLIKDYQISIFPNDKEKIEKEKLIASIKRFGDTSKIQIAASRAAWLGNDETHYVRKWNDKNVEDLKKLISITIHWIEMEIDTEQIEIDMPA